jgi:DeoR/GlpR family transcriptional regulator of sugar metabolism
MRWSWWTARRKLAKLEQQGRAKRVGRTLVAPASVLAEAIPGFREPNPLEREVADLRHRVAELERRLDAKVTGHSDRVNLRV